ncbi:phage minor head protein [Thermomonas sp.]|uniref:phage head morphogenesis protein n=1 Tax=Thermomonas sp. TaxID=1971895 RepID=UPI002615E20B|nr:phage minor head protein [Thermomonas sp.]
MPDIRIASRPFAEQVAFFRRKVSVPTGGWWDLQRADHAHGFMVAGAFKLDLLDDLRSIVQGAIDSGMPLREFRKAFDEIVTRHGWAYKGGRNWRTRVIYETNVRQSYNAGRWQQLTSPAMSAARPYLQYRHNDKGTSRMPRPLHVSWDGLVLRNDDPWWRTHAPMNGWGCKCGIRALSPDDLKALGKDGPDTAPNDGSYAWTAPDGGQHEVPNGVDPGFDFNAGEEARSLSAARRFGERVMDLPPAWRERALEDARRRADDWHADAGDMIDAMLRGAPRGDAAVGMLLPGTARALEERGLAPTSALMLVRALDAQALQSVAGESIGFALRDLPARMPQPDVVLLDAIAHELVYAWRVEDGYRRARWRMGDGGNVLVGLDTVPASVLRLASGQLLVGSVP